MILSRRRLCITRRNRRQIALPIPSQPDRRRGHFKSALLTRPASRLAGASAKKAPASSQRFGMN
jgi:hypothetical protein